MKIPEDGRSTRPRGRPRSFDRTAALDRALEVFWRNGYEATSIHDLTTAMGINPPSLYSAFGDKERLFLEAVSRYQSGPGRTAYALAESSPTARAAIRRLLEVSAIEFTRSSHPPGCMVVGSGLSCSSSPRIQACLKKYRSAGERWMRARIRRGIADGELSGTSASALAKLYMTVMEGMTIQARDGATRAKLLAVVDAAMAAWPVP